MRRAEVEEVGRLSEGPHFPGGTPAASPRRRVRGSSSPRRARWARWPAKRLVRAKRSARNGRAAAWRAVRRRARRHAAPPSARAAPREFRPPAEPAGQRREQLLEHRAQPRFGAEMIDQHDLAAGPQDASNSSSVASGSGTAVMTYCATTTSKEASSKPRFCASITASPSTLLSPCSRTRAFALRGIGIDRSTPTTRVVQRIWAAKCRCRRRLQGCVRRSARPRRPRPCGRARTPRQIRNRRSAPSAA